MAEYFVYFLTICNLDSFQVPCDHVLQNLDELYIVRPGHILNICMYDR